MLTKRCSLRYGPLALALALVACSAKDDPTFANGGADSGANAGPGGSTAGGSAAGAIGGSGGSAPGTSTVTGSSTVGTHVTPVPGSGIMPIAIDQCGATNPGGLNAAQVGALKAGGNAGSMRVLYPYEGTVFPRGLTAPMLMWEGAGSDGVYVHLKASNFEYHGCLRANAAGQMQFLVGQAMKASKGSGNPSLIKELILEELP